MISTLVTIPENTACLYFIINLIFLWSILYSFWSLNWVLVSPPPHIDQMVWVWVLTYKLFRLSAEGHMVTLWVYTVRQSSHTRDTLLKLGWMACTVWRSPRELFLPFLFWLIFFWNIQSNFLSSGFNHGWTKTTNVGKSIYMSTQGKKLDTLHFNYK